VEVVTIETPELGDRTYLVHDGSEALLVDPQRDVDRVLATVAAAGVRVGLVLETHIHNDYVTGGLALARELGAIYGVAADDPVTFDRHPLREGDQLSCGTLRVLAVHTPGHTPTHLSYVVTDPAGRQAVFTGGSLLYGTVGRTDLSGPGRTVALSRAQYRSARRLMAELDEPVHVQPTHGFGSFCASAAGSSATSSTIGRERQVNLAARLDDEDAFVATLIGGLTAYPSYYAHMAARNLSGPPAADLTPPPALAGAEVRQRIAAGQWVVDVRPRAAFAAAHLAGSIGAELADPFATYLGWLLPWGTPVTVLAETETDVAEAQRALARIGIDRLAGSAVGSLDGLAGGQPLRAYPVVDFGGLAAASRRGRRPVVLDVRRDDEWQAGHLPGALHVPLPDLPDRVAALPPDELWVHCASGYRASVAASLLDRGGHRVVLVDDDFENAASNGLPLSA
jgi:hydroxyacylglutathione hydrolase